MWYFRWYWSYATSSGVLQASSGLRNIEKEYGQQELQELEELGTWCEEGLSSTSLPRHQDYHALVIIKEEFSDAPNSRECQRSNSGAIVDIVRQRVQCEVLWKIEYINVNGVFNIPRANE